MAFTPRTFEEVRDDMIAYVRMQTELTDFEVGSVIRTIIEAAALEDDEQYFQMVMLLDAFRLTSAAGQDLDDRVAEYNIIRLQPQAASGTVLIENGNLVTSDLVFSVPSSATSAFIENSSAFPTSGFPYVVRIGEGTTAVEDIDVSANNTGTGQLTFSSPLVNAHGIAERVSLVSGSDITLQPGIRVQVPATSTTASIIFDTTETGTIVAGNFQSTPIRALAEIPGSDGNIGTSKITQFVSSLPFNGALVTNITNFAGGRDLESDDELRDRARAQIQSLSRGTVLSLQQGVLGVEDTVTGQRVTTANILEDFVADEVIVYIDDGTGFTPDQVDLARTTLASPVTTPTSSLSLTDVSQFVTQGILIIEPENTANMEVLPFSAVNFTTNTVTLSSPTVNSHLAGVEVAVVDAMTLDAESGERFFTLSNYPIIRSSFRLWVQPPSLAPVLKQENIDYFLNRGTGEIEFISFGVAAGSAVFANYSYYTALMFDAQKVINGDPSDPTDFPGLRPAGVRVIVDVPVIRRITVRLSITAKPGFQEVDLAPTVQEAIEAYINGLGIGGDVIRAEIIRRAMSVTGVADTIVTIPTSNVIVLENELPRPNDISGASLVTVN